ncbi:helix-turn-helix domain-containing protein [Actinomadura violacea]|uniref:Helix-turn-helix transcriptional regulator n=1 Tax=Actinomadura violacea TaxID=2819934 RepID=A0ABS3S181_9ACTN|nr:helix-turn-helix transcriptional regulator [Actinomadura violacea]MBO2462666.1 helix-turn-helix transcriptional regulator [Actinomadura violacea]
MGCRSWTRRPYGARLARGASLDALAATVGGAVTRQQLIDDESGARRPDPPRLVALAEAPQVPPEYLACIKPYRADLADLRHWAGLTAELAAPHFGFSRWSLLRAEKIGRLPMFHSPDDFVAMAAAIYARPNGIVLGALRRAQFRALLARHILGM